MASDQILEIICDWDVLGLDCTKEVLHDWVGVVAEADLDRTIETVDVTVVAGTLVGLVLLHQRDEFLGGPTLSLEVVVVRSRCTGIHHEVDAGATTENVGTRYNRTSAAEPFRGPGVVEGRSLAVELHVLGVDTWAVHPRVLRVRQPLIRPGTRFDKRTFKLLSPASMSMTWRLWSKLAKRPATTQPHDPPPTTMISTSSGTVMMVIS